MEKIIEGLILTIVSLLSIILLSLMIDDVFLNGRGGIIGMFSSIREPSTFKDTCEAKAYLKAYIEQH